jgi:putative ABC transport system permease protein
MDKLLQDLRFATRALRRNPVFTGAAVLTLALGIGANTAVFSVVNGVLLRALPYPDAERIVVGFAKRGAEKILLVSIPDVREWESASRSFESIGIERSQSVNLTGVDAPDRLIGSFITANTFTILGARAERGRLFTAEEASEVGGQAVAVLSHGAWVSRFGSDPNIVGRRVTLNGRPHVVIGVLSSAFHDPQSALEVFLPLSSAPQPNWAQRGGYNVWTIAKMKPGVTIAQAQKDLSAIMARLAKEFPESNSGYDANLIPLKEMVVGEIQPALLTIFGFVAVVLLIACANVANLQMARATSRQRELSLRAALGAGRGRLARQLFTENLLLSVVGGAAGLVIAVWGTRVLVAAIPGGLPALLDVGLDGRVLAFSTVVTLGAGLVFGAAPALYGGRIGLRESLDARSGAPVSRRGFDGRDAVVAMQLALCVVLLVGAGLLARTLVALRRVDPGFDATNVISAEFRLPVAKYKSDEEKIAFMTNALAAIRKVPGVTNAAMVQAVPLSGNFGRVTYELDGQPVPATKPASLANVVSDGFFRTLRMPINAGRDFDANDRLSAPMVAIVSEEFARQAWPGQDPLGHRVKIDGPPDAWVTVVGVVPDVKQHSLNDPASAMIYQPMLQSPDIFNSVVARTRGDPDALGSAVRAAIWSVDRDQPVWKVRSLESLVNRDIAPRSFALTLAGVFAVIAVVLAAIGVYGVMSYLLAQRTREVGIRMALGARESQVVRLVVRRGARVIAVAVIIGSVAALLAARLLRSQLYGVEAADPLTFLAVSVLLGAIALLATYIPARRAARVDPMIALRTE